MMSTTWAAGPDEGRMETSTNELSVASDRGRDRRNRHSISASPIRVDIAESHNISPAFDGVCSTMLLERQYIHGIHSQTSPASTACERTKSLERTITTADEIHGAQSQAATSDPGETTEAQNTVCLVGVTK